MKRLIAALLISIFPALMQGQMLQAVVGQQANAATPTTVTFITNGWCNGNAGGNSTLCNWTSTAPAAGKGVVIGIMLFNSGQSVTSVGDGTGTNQLTGSSTYTCNSIYNNGTNFSSEVCYTCNYQGVSGSGKSVTILGSEQLYVYGISMTGQTTSGTGCSDGYAHGQSTSAGTAMLSGTITTTNAHDLLIGFAANNCGSSPMTAGTDGQSNTMTMSGQQSNVAGIEYLAESATHAYQPSATTGSCKWNLEAMAFK